MAEEEIKVEGAYAVRVGKMWVNKNYSTPELVDAPKSLISFKEAKSLADKTGGEIFIFKPEKLDEKRLEDMKMAVQNSGE